jgi:DNA-binding MarR family transcriptional regulator
MFLSLYTSLYLKPNMAKNKPKRELAEEIDLLHSMLSSLVEILEEKGVLTQEEWEKQIKKRTKIR